jgi:hypothetical protein
LILYGLIIEKLSCLRGDLASHFAQRNFKNKSKKYTMVKKIKYILWPPCNW